jgi:uncharacterized OB-fold protein
MMDVTAKPILDGIFEEGPPGRLLGGYCPGCNRKYFPRPVVCPQCLNALDSIPLSPDGTIYSFTVVRTKAPFGLPQPYAIGYVDLEKDGLRIISLLDSEKLAHLAVGVPVTLRVDVVGVGPDGQPCLRYFFSPKDERREGA